MAFLPVLAFGGWLLPCGAGFSYRVGAWRVFCVSPVAAGAVWLSTCPFILSSEMSALISSPFSKIRLFVFLLLSFESSLYIPDQPYTKCMLCKDFLPVSGLFLLLFTVSVEEPMLLSHCDLGIRGTKPSPCPYSQRFSHMPLQFWCCI